jgi:hypothetical protein
MTAHACESAHTRELTIGSLSLPKHFYAHVPSTSKFSVGSGPPKRGYPVLLFKSIMF